MAEDQINIFLNLLRGKVFILWSHHPVNFLKYFSLKVTCCPLTSAPAGQMASRWGEKNPTVDTGTSDDPDFVPTLLRSFPVNYLIPKCVYVYNQNCKKCSDTVLVVRFAEGWWWWDCVHICLSKCVCLFGFFKCARHIWLLTWKLGSLCHWVFRVKQNNFDPNVIKIKM